MEGVGDTFVYTNAVFVVFIRISGGVYSKGAKNGGGGKRNSTISCVRV